MPTREILPARRDCETITFNFGGQHDYTAQIGYYPDGRPGEVFLNHAKASTSMDIAARDSAILLSFCLQYGVPLGKIREAMTRDKDGNPEGALGQLLDLLHSRGQV